MNMTSGFRTLVGTVAAGLLVIAPARAHILANNVNEGTGYTESVSSTDWLGTSFTTDSRAWNLTSVDLSIDLYGGNPQDIVVRLFSDDTSGGPTQPGVPLATLEFAGNVSWLLTRFVSEGVVLDPLKHYWIVVSTPAGTSGDWEYAWTNFGGGVGFLTDWASSGDAGASWLTSSGQPMTMRVNAEPAPWTSLGPGLAGTMVAGSPDPPVLDADDGDLTAGSSGMLFLDSAKPHSSALFFVSTSSAPTPFKGGTLLTVPIVLSLALPVDFGGGSTVAWSSWPAGLSGTTLYFQFAVKDAGAPKGVSLSNAMKASVP
jgi:hypothetical protein